MLFYRLAIFDDKAIEIFEKGIGGFYRYTDGERETVCALDEMDLGIVDRDRAGESVLLVFDDVAEAWKRVKSEKFEAYRKKASWVWKCLYWTEELYGYTPIENFLDVINIKKELRMEGNELIEIFDQIVAVIPFYSSPRTCRSPDICLPPARFLPCNLVWMRPHNEVLFYSPVQSLDGGSVQVK